MKVILVNGSPREKGCTYTALCEVAGALEKNGIETEIFQVGAKPIAGCIGCNVCLKNGRCFVDDPVNEFVEKAKTADGFVFGSPVHYAAASGAITSFLDRAFYGKGNVFAGKPGAAVVSCRRGGAASAFDQLNKYFTINSMPVVSSQYWNQVHGNTRRTRYGRTQRDCRPCARWAAIWHGCSNVFRQGRQRESHSRSGNLQ